MLTSGVTKCLFGGGGGWGKEGARPLSEGVGGGQDRNNFFSITFIVHNQKSTGGANGGPMVRMGGHGLPLAPTPHPPTPVLTRLGK